MKNASLSCSLAHVLYKDNMRFPNSILVPSAQRNICEWSQTRNVCKHALHVSEYCTAAKEYSNARQRMNDS